MIKAEVLKDSINKHTNSRVVTFLVTFHRFILPEVLTHRVFSRNTSSSRAIPAIKTISNVWKNPAIPIRFGKAKKGMQDAGSLSNTYSFLCTQLWLLARIPAIVIAWLLLKCGLHKQIANRVLEPWVWTTMVITSTEWENWYSLRYHKDAQPEIQELAKVMLEAHQKSEPQVLDVNEWHLPFIKPEEKTLPIDVQIKKSVARCARTSYVNFYGKDSEADDLRLFNELQKSRHFSPFDHPCLVQLENKFYGNLKGFKPYRKYIPNESGQTDNFEIRGFNPHEKNNL